MTVALLDNSEYDCHLGTIGTHFVDSEEDSDSEDESSGGTEGSCSYSDSNSDSDDESSGDEEEEDTGSNSDYTSEHSEQTFSIQETNFESVRVPRYRSNAMKSV